MFSYSYSTQPCLSSTGQMGNCWPKWKVGYSQKKDRIKKWVESVSQPHMEMLELRSIQEPERTNLVRINAMSDISVLSPALAMSKTSLNSSVIFFDAREYADSGDEESTYESNCRGTHFCCFERH